MKTKQQQKTRQTKQNKINTSQLWDGSWKEGALGLPAAIGCDCNDDSLSGNVSGARMIDPFLAKVGTGGVDVVIDNDDIILTRWSSSLCWTVRDVDDSDESEDSGASGASVLCVVCSSVGAVGNFNLRSAVWSGITNVNLKDFWVINFIFFDNLRKRNGIIKVRCKINTQVQVKKKKKWNKRRIKGENNKKR